MRTELAGTKEYITSVQQLTEALLDRYLPSVEADPQSLHTAMRYSVMAGGKRLRPILCYAAYEACGGELEGRDLPIHQAMAAIEMVHTYSLIHDDLPCMDDDDLRRGIPTCHKKFGEAVAVLAGDALHDVAFDLMARTGSTDAVRELAAAIGTSGMLGGQIADIEAEGRQVSADEIQSIHRRKTAALLRSSVRLGAMLAGTSNERLDHLSRFGERLGLAFQITDDILDIEGDPSLLGKTVGSDFKKLKATYPGVVGMEQARNDARRLITEAIDSLDDFADSWLAQLARYIGQRNS